MGQDLMARIEAELTYLDGVGRYRYEFDPSRIEPSVAVVSTVAAVTDTSPTEVDPPLAEIVEPDSIDRLFVDGDAGATGEPDHLVFYLGGCRVFLFADDRVEVSPPANAA